MINSALFSDRFSVVKKIGSGGMSSVYLCTDRNIHKRWAVKVIKSSDEKVSCNSEIDLLKSMDYYMFPRIVDAFFDAGYIYIVTDYIEGETLASYLKAKGGLPINVVIRYVEELIKALMYLHSLSPPILYLDMKPENIMIRSDGQIRLIDFGIAGNILLKSRCLGTIRYSPPEQYVLGATLSRKTDVFALGMTFYEMITGEKPDKDLDKQRDNVKNCRQIPGRVKEIILMCIEENQNSRPELNEILSLIQSKKTKDKGIIPMIAITAVTAVTATCMILLGIKGYKDFRLERNKKEMLYEAAQYMDGNQYTLQGIKVICGYIDGNFLDRESTDNYTYEVAKYYFNVQKDYASAKAYFTRIKDIETYPDVNEYIRLCESMRGFDDDEKLMRMFSAQLEE